MVALFLASVVQNDVEAPRHGHNELGKCLVGVAPTLRSTGNIVQVIHPANGKRHMAIALDECQITPGIGNLRQLYDLAVR